MGQRPLAACAGVRLKYYPIAVDLRVVPWVMDHGVSPSFEKVSRALRKARCDFGFSLSQWVGK